MLMNLIIVEIILLFCKKIKEGGNMNSIQKYRGLAIADYFVKKCIEQNIPVTNMSILKMIYFAHGFSYALRHKPLIKDPFLAWPWGPVEKHTYDCFKKYSANPITSISGETNDELIKIEKDKELCIFLDKFIPLAKASPFVLSDKSHVSGGPWDVTPAFKEIDEKIIQVYFCAKYGNE